MFDRAHSTLVWLAVLAFVLPEPAARGLVILAMVAVALAAAAVAFLAPVAPYPDHDPDPEPPDGEPMESDHGL
ncbi:hypothetical protein OLX02_17365 [Novosphingobium sp. KCTC 2891]|uniref:hypothetical protein n=1 Tax=Novosphingobium sp. KCTC 2891 TaxID=2989730 RepID=UPI002222714D|nr:hypothetical protein [Novosphingobium sp. KCTC 2891]MCW1384594.1 hypothetical protein [Novosphingobium sp. KCTC 2891]